MRIFIVLILLNSFPVFAQEKESVVLDSKKFLIHFKDTKKIGEKVDSLEYRLDLQQDYLIKGTSKSDLAELKGDMESDITDLKGDMKWAIGGSWGLILFLFSGFGAVIKFGWSHFDKGISGINEKLDKLMIMKK